jgi:hypothetical protein
MISELNGWPAFTTSRDASTTVVTDSRPPWVAEVTGLVFFVGLFHSRSQTGLSRHTQFPIRSRSQIRCLAKNSCGNQPRLLLG